MRLRPRKRILVVNSSTMPKANIAKAYLDHFIGHQAETICHSDATETDLSLYNDAMKETGLTISNMDKIGLNEFISQDFDYIITFDKESKEVLPHFSTGAIRIHRDLSKLRKSQSQNEMKEMIKLRDAVRETCRLFSKVHFANVKSNPKSPK